MAEPSKERIAAALVLAEAVCALATAVDGEGAVPPALLQARQDALRAYRATAPKLRTRAEVDAEIVSRFRSAYASGSLVGSLVEIGELCREETAPEEPNRVTDHDADTRELQDPEPCGCQLAERVDRLERATEMAPYAARIRALREIRDDLEGE
jgi:hypothetical protein